MGLGAEKSPTGRSLCWGVKRNFCEILHVETVLCDAKVPTS